ncbi:MAG: DMT family transporter [Pseudomonadota bacterium]
MRRETALLLAILVVLGASWGVTQPLAKIAVSEGYRHFAIVFWQLVIGAVLLGAIVLAQGRTLPRSARHIRLYLLIALIGTIFPNSASYQAVVHLPAGIVSILMSLVPMLAFPMALALGIDRFNWGRLLGLCLGFAGVILLVAPETSLPNPAMVAFIPLALIAPTFYALEGNVVAKWGTLDLNPVQLLCGASCVGIPIAGVLAVGSGQFISPLPPWGLPDLAIVLSSTLHTVVYVIYLWLVGRAGAVFAAQVAYLVTGFGVIWAMLILGERFSVFVWAALLAMFLGLFLVQPRPRGTVERTVPAGQ